MINTDRFQAPRPNEEVLFAMEHRRQPRHSPLREREPSSPSLQPAISELERVFAAACSWFTPRILPKAVITIQSKGRRAALGWFSARRWENQDRQHLPEINISAESLQRHVLDIAEVLLHEMVHYANAVAGIRDVSSN